MNQSIEIPFTDLYGQYEECQLEIDEAFHETVRKSDFLTGPTTEKFEKKIINNILKETVIDKNMIE